MGSEKEPLLPPKPAAAKIDKRDTGSSTPSSSSWTAEDLEAWRASMQDVHDSGVNFGYSWRRTQLKAMRQMMEENLHRFTDALYQDLNKEMTESIGTELELIMGEIQYFERNLRQHMKPKHVAGPGVLFPSWSWIESKPLLGPGVLIIGPFNYPVMLCLQPAVGSLASGNPTIIKPSELSPSVSALIAELIPKYFDPSACRVVLGGVEETKTLLSYPWGKVFFTGSSRVGRLVAQQTANTLTPTVLELGGKCPCYIDGYTSSTFDWQLVANRIIWAKCLNAGQTCAAVDFVVCPQDKLDKLLPCLVKAVETQFGKDPSQSEMARIVQAQPHANRLVDLLKQVEDSAKRNSNNNSQQPSPCQIVLGGSADCQPEERYIRPSIVVNPPLDSRMMQEEIFGPILPIVTVQSRSEGIQVLKKVESRLGTPLCMYVFTNSDQVFSEITTQCRAGSAMRNECLVILGNHQTPFGGLGRSGIGAYHGPHSFQTFSQQLPCMHRPLWPGSDFGGLRNHPFGTGLKRFLVQKVAFALPDVPPIPKALKWTVGVATLAVLIAQVFPRESLSLALLQPMLTPIADALVRFAELLKSVGK